MLIRVSLKKIPSEGAAHGPGSGMSKGMKGLFPDGLEHPRFRNRRAGRGIYIICRKSAIAEAEKRSELSIFNPPSPTRLTDEQCLTSATRASRIPSFRHVSRSISGTSSACACSRKASFSLHNCRPARTAAPQAPSSAVSPAPSLRKLEALASSRSRMPSRCSFYPP